MLAYAQGAGLSWLNLAWCSGQAGGPAMIQVIPVDLFAGFTRFHTAGIPINNATHTGSAFQVLKEMPGNDIWSFMREHPELRVPARW